MLSCLSLLPCPSLCKAELVFENAECYLESEHQRSFQYLHQREMLDSRILNLEFRIVPEHIYQTPLSLSSSDCS